MKKQEKSQCIVKLARELRKLAEKNISRARDNEELEIIETQIININLLIRELNKI